MQKKSSSIASHQPLSLEEPGSPSSFELPPHLNTSPPMTRSKAKKCTGRSTDQINDDNNEAGEQLPYEDDHDFGESQELLFKRSISLPAKFSMS